MIGEEEQPQDPGQEGSQPGSAWKEQRGAAKQRLSMGPAGPQGPGKRVRIILSATEGLYVDSIATCGAH